MIVGLDQSSLICFIMNNRWTVLNPLKEGCCQVKIKDCIRWIIMDSHASINVALSSQYSFIQNMRNTDYTDINCKLPTPCLLVPQVLCPLSSVLLCSRFTKPCCSSWNYFNSCLCQLLLPRVLLPLAQLPRPKSNRPLETWQLFLFLMI